MNEEITIQVSHKVAQSYKKATERQKQCLETLVSLFFDEEVEQNLDILGRIMDEISDKAISRGLTPEILDSILNE